MNIKADGLRRKVMTKPNCVRNCKHLETCHNGKLGNCVGCNVWNYLYDAKALIEWCHKTETPVSGMTMDMHKQLVG